MFPLHFGFCLGRCWGGDLRKQTDTQRQTQHVAEWSVDPRRLLRRHCSSLPAMEHVRTTHRVSIWESPGSMKQAEVSWTQNRGRTWARRICQEPPGELPAGEGPGGRCLSAVGRHHSRREGRCFPEVLGGAVPNLESAAEKWG